MQKITLPLPEVLARIELDPAVRPLLDGVATVAEALAILEERDQPMTAVRVLGQALPPREAVWWACVSARAAPDPAATPEDLAALQAADAWVRRPSDENRRAAMAAAEAAGTRSPEAWAAVAAFWSGGSLGPPNVPEMPPAPHMCGVAVASSVILAAVRNDPSKAGERYARFIASARDIAQGGGG
jgi:hypothetical protein